MGCPIENVDLTPIQKFYSNTRILITGATGFFGRILLEKLLRSCPNVSKIYILIRQKKGKDSKTRSKEILDDVLFHRLKAERPNFGDTVIGIDGDCTLPNLGLSSQDIETLKQEVNIVFHLAATVNFAEKLKTATFINIRATKHLLQLAREMPDLKAFLHVSTAYANCLKKVTKEKIYPPALDGDTMISMAENLPDEIFDKISDTLVGEFPNTYTFTKQIAESIVKEDGQGLPIGIHRPAIAVSTYREPIKSWINNTYTVTGLVAYVGSGIVRTVQGNTACKGNVVPIDMCMNSLIAMAWEVGTSFASIKKQKGYYEIPVYHYESNSDKPIAWGFFFRNALGSETPYIYKNQYVYQLQAFLLHTFPAFILDLISLSLGKPSKMIKMYSKVHKLIDVLSYFALREWSYESRNVNRLLDKMCDKDREIFFFDISKIDWHEYFKTYFYGIRLYVLKQPKETIPLAQKKLEGLFGIYRLFSSAVGISLIWLMWRLFK